MKANDLTISDLDHLFISDIDNGEYLIHRDVFRDQAIFDLEMKYIFERNWIFLGLESRVPNPNDYFTTQIGRTPVIVTRDAKGELGAFINSCPHKGARVCQLSQGNARGFVCPYHGWTFDMAGNNVLIKDDAEAGYSESFRRLDHGLEKIKFGNYRGLLFGSLWDGVPSLDEHLASIKPLIDLVVDQGPEGIETIPGYSSYTYDGNWKFQIENCIDMYHLTSAHPSFVNIVARRQQGESRNQQVKSIDFTQMMQVDSGTYTFPRGHAIVWSKNPQDKERPLYLSIDEVRKRVGDLRAEWMLYTRNLTIYPNVQFAENASLQMRMIRPLAPGKTEMTIFCIGVKNESDAAREIRLRQYEDFFNTSGLATPDDTQAYEDCQVGLESASDRPLQGYARGMGLMGRGPDEYARELGFAPETYARGPSIVQDETVMHGGYRAWRQMIAEGLRSDGKG